LAPFGDAADWYAAFDAGYAATSDLRATAKGLAQDGSKVRLTFETKDKPAFSVRLGKYLGDHFRTEIDIQHKSASFGRIEGSGTAPNGICSFGDPNQNQALDCSRADGARTRSWSLLANAIYDFGAPDATFRPYVGAGIGLALNATGFQGKLKGIGPDTGFTVQKCIEFSEDEPPFCYYEPDADRMRREVITSQDRSSAFTWQLVAGGSLKLTEQLRIDAMYRFVNMPSMKFSSFNNDEATPTLGSFTNSYKAHFVSIGARWAFGRKPK
jgi:opacity protein-like surface antigen